MSENELRLRIGLLEEEMYSLQDELRLIESELDSLYAHLENLTGEFL